MKRDSPQLELTMPDESRDLPLSERCRGCGGPVTLERTNVASSSDPELQAVADLEIRYFATCQCTRTPELKSSREALAHWRMMVLMENQ